MVDVGRREDRLLDAISALTSRRDRALAIVRDPDLAPDLTDLATAIELALTT